MAVDMQSGVFSLQEKFSDLKSYDNELSTNMSTTCKNSNITHEPYEIKPITKNYVEKVIDHLRVSFFKDEPLNLNIQLLDESNPTCVELEGYAREHMSDRYSLMAISKSGKIVGACLNGVAERGAPEEEEKECPNEKFRKILGLLDFVEKEVNIFERFPDISKVLSCHILSVDSTWRGRGIGQRLLDGTREIAREQGIGLIRVDCTSHFSAKLIAKLGFECIYTLKYLDYKEDGKTIFNPEPPHREVTVYVQKTTNNNKL